MTILRRNRGEYRLERILRVTDATLSPAMSSTARALRSSAFLWPRIFFFLTNLLARPDVALIYRGRFFTHIGLITA